MKQPINEEKRLKELIRAASPCTCTPVGLETRIMAQVAGCERRRRERRAIVEMALYCVVFSAAAAVLAGVGIAAVGWANWPALLLLLAGTVGMALVCCCDRMNELLRRL